MIQIHGLETHHGDGKQILRNKQFHKGRRIGKKKKVLIKWGIPENKLYTIYNSLSYDEQLPLRKSIKQSTFYQEYFGNNNPNLVFIGRLTTVKKLDQILIAVKKLKNDGHLFNVTFIGDGTVKVQLESQATKLGLKENVWFYGALYDEKKIAEFLYNADICVSPGNVGLTAMHAMTFGCPVISHDNFPSQMPEFEAIEIGRTGAFFKENDTESLAEVIKEWIANCGDREAVRQACYKVIDEKYNPHIQISIIKDVINK